MLRKLRERIQSEERGFTLIELLVVILIIGILAAIAIPAFLSQTDKADDASAKSAARNAQTAAETYNVDNGGSYLNMTQPALEAIEEALPDDLAVSGADDNGYTVTATSDTGITYSVQREGGAITRNCTVPANSDTAGGCQGVADPAAGGTGTW